MDEDEMTPDERNAEQAVEEAFQQLSTGERVMMRIGSRLRWVEENR